MSLLMPVPSYPDYYNFVVSFEINCESFFKSVLTILSVLHFPYECWNQLVIFCKKDSWDFDKDYIFVITCFLLYSMNCVYICKKKKKTSLHTCRKATCENFDSMTITWMQDTEYSPHLRRLPNISCQSLLFYKSSHCVVICHHWSVSPPLNFL